ncbi:DUF7173 family protein [Xylophilus sp.]|uniref:DUF7173 family protein n=1 Tax=Xylophilus sp. TaxID=2653893 RepID=UPI0013BA441D|nr:hypothetical protein [Xylophilus sp.]KAF1045645.1 MAG: hypothetical protein GAK38_02937 [Xylophilus sp.]
MNPIDLAARNLELAKRTEFLATQARIEAEHELISLLPTKDEGSVTMKGNDYKVSITYGYNRTVDEAALSAVKDEIATDLFDQVINYKPSLSITGLRYMQSNQPGAYALLAQVITSKPAKPSVRIEAIPQDLAAAA